MALSSYDTLTLGFGGVRTINVYNGSLTATVTATVQTPLATNRIFLVGLNFSETSAVNLQLISNNTTIHTLELGANQGTWDKVGNGFIFATKTGEALKLQASADISSILIYTIEATTYRAPFCFE